MSLPHRSVNERLAQYALLFARFEGNVLDANTQPGKPHYRGVHLAVVEFPPTRTHVDAISDDASQTRSLSTCLLAPLDYG